MNKRIRLATVLVLASSCQHSAQLFHGQRSATLREAGSVHLSVLSVAPWSDYTAAMQPNFELTADGALAKVAADSRWTNDEDSSMVQAGRESVALDRASGGARPLEFPGLRPGDSDPALRPPALLGPGSAPGTGEGAAGPDAMLKYTAATALYQEVQLLNRYIHDAAIPNGYRPYLVRLQVSLMPSRRHAPYDAYTTLSFFIPGERPAGDAGEDVSSNTDAIFREPFGNGPKVLPLLVTDNLEASVQSRSLDRIRSLIFSMVEFPNSSVVEQMASALLHNAMRDQVFGRDLNSLLTVARMSENTLRIRLGAMQETTANYAMVPRNHNITLLLMVPDGSPALMEVVARTELVDAESGELLLARDAQATQSALDAVRRDARFKGLPAPALERLMGLAERNDQSGFTAVLRQSLPADHRGVVNDRALWIDLLALVAGGQLNSHLFELPGQGEDVAASREVFQQQTVVAEDDGNEARVVLREVRFPEFERLLVTLSLAGAEPPILLPARGVEFDSLRRELSVVFPSPRRWKLFEAQATGSPPVLQLKLLCGGEELRFDALYREVSAFDAGTPPFDSR